MSDSTTSSYRVVFEDDGATAYLCACDRSLEGNTILDAVHIYNVADQSGRPLQLELAWSPDGLKAGLWLAGTLYGVVDFATRRAYSRTNFPPPGGPWTAEVREPWTDALADLFAHPLN
jgi:hypothetical protein